MPDLYIIAGPNGAGKTTFARQFLPQFAGCLEFINADMIAAGLSPFNPDVAAFRAGRLVLEQIQLLSKRNLDFGFETTLSGRSYTRILEQLKQSGYQIHIFFLWVRSIELALARIADRVRRGGHGIPSNTVRRRFDRGLSNFFNLYRPLADSWTIFDNSAEKPLTIAFGTSATVRVIDDQLFHILSKEVSS
ncbi:MAG: zeta toxin family protein [Pseudomonadota bacterium]